MSEKFTRFLRSSVFAKPAVLMSIVPVRSAGRIVLSELEGAAHLGADRVHEVDFKASEFTRFRVVEFEGRVGLKGA